MIEDDEDDVLLIREYLAEAENIKFEVSWEPNVPEARKKMLNGEYGIFLIDFRLGSDNGLDLIKFIQDKGVLTPSIILTGHGDLKVDIDASRFGASDYLVKTELNSQQL
ncbi:MAG TPA: response regulator, partial [Saprospiraceae bacterium]|nr:response regulator [Saprospiraceae bacterium]